MVRHAVSHRISFPSFRHNDTTVLLCRVANQNRDAKISPTASSVTYGDAPLATCKLRMEFGQAARAREPRMLG
jgi:hypothetical protein